MWQTCTVIPAEPASTAGRRSAPHVRIVQLPAQNAHEVEQLLATLREAGLDVEDVEMRKADLEDVFIDLMAGEQTPLEVAR